MRSFFICCLSVAVKVFLFSCYEFTPIQYPLRGLIRCLFLSDTFVVSKNAIGTYLHYLVVCILFFGNC